MTLRFRSTPNGPRLRVEIDIDLSVQEVLTVLAVATESGDARATASEADVRRALEDVLTAAARDLPPAAERDPALVIALAAFLPSAAALALVRGVATEPSLPDEPDA